MITIDAGQLNRFMQCNSYMRLQADPAYSSPDVTIREEGNAAHWLASIAFKDRVALIDALDKKAPNGIFITAEIIEHVSDYLSFIDRSPRSVQFTEWPYTLDGPNYRISGRGDHISQDGNLLNVDDFKYGFTIVEPEMNWTLISHAVGWIVNSGFERPKWITFTIHQPRAAHRNGRVRSWEISYSELYELWLKLSGTLSNPSDNLQTGAHCYKCPSFIGCIARQDAEQNAIEVSRRAYTAEIDNRDLSVRMIEIDRAENLLKQSKRAYEELALHRIKSGEIIEGFSAENDLTNRVLKDFVTPELLRVLIGDDMCERKLPTPKKLEDAKTNQAIVSILSERRNKGTKLVKINADQRAKKLFGKKEEK